MILRPLKYKNMTHGTEKLKIKDLIVIFCHRTIICWPRKAYMDYGGPNLAKRDIGRT